MRRVIKGFLFDVHGTLVDKGGSAGLEGAWGAAVNFLRQTGYRFVTVEAYRQAYWETLKSFREEINALKELDFYLWYGGILERLGLPARNEFIDRLNAAYMEGFAPYTTRIAGARSLLAWLRESGSRLVAVSNGFARNTRLDLERTELFHFFDEIICSSDVGRRKPDPAVLKKALQGLGLASEEVIMVGNDVIEDVVAAKTLGMKVALVRRSDGMVFIRDACLDYRNLDAEKEPDWQVQDLAELKRKIISGEVG